MKRLFLYSFFFILVVSCTPEGGNQNVLALQPNLADEITVEKSIESPHPYSDNSTLQWEITAPEGAEKIVIPFDILETESSYDFVNIYDVDGNLIHSISGDHSGESYEIFGNYAKIQLVSDVSIVKEGISISHYIYYINNHSSENGDGTRENPYLIHVSNVGADYSVTKDTSQSGSSFIDSYPGASQNESGPEHIYTFTLPVSMKVTAYIDTPEPTGTDIDVHLLSSLNPLSLIKRDNSKVITTLSPGKYYLVLDTYGGDNNAGEYSLHVKCEPSYGGSRNNPVLLGVQNLSTPVSLPHVLVDERDTREASSSVIDYYPGSGSNESGHEYYYAFTVDRPVYFAAEIMLPEPTGVDIDLHLLSGLAPLNLIERDDHKIIRSLNAGTYYLVMDTFGGTSREGHYLLNITLREKNPPASKLFNSYILSAVNYINGNYKLLGYNISSVFTHDMYYGSYGDIPQSGVNGKTMCVAASLEIMLTAMRLYEQDTGDSSVWNFLPRRSFASLRSSDIRAHIWVNHGDLDSDGTADALRHFGMGINVPFEELKPGSFVNINRTSGSGHSVVFISFIDSVGNEYAVYNNNVVGFKYFSAQGHSTPGTGGMDYRYAIFSEFGCPSMPGNRDCNIIHSDDQLYLNTGMMYAPQYWRDAYYGVASSKSNEDVSFFDAEYFDPITTDDNQ